MITNKSLSGINLFHKAQYCLAHSGIFPALVSCSPFFRQENKVEIYSSLNAKK